MGHPRTKEIIARVRAKVPSATVIEISHYKDVFCRSGQKGALQRQSQKLILASKERAKTGGFFYPGAPVCQDFGNANFYYTSCMMNCIYDCAYCYLKGMYPSANIVLFVNIEELFAQAEELLRKGPLYLCVSYDTDLLAMEPIAGYAGAWNRFAQAQGAGLTIEIRTKCANRRYFQQTEPVEQVIYAFTLSPQEIADACESGTPALRQRIACAAEAVDRGFRVRLCFDPMIYIHGWERYYHVMIEDVFAAIPAARLVDVSVGSFRIPKDYLKQMRRQDAGNAAAWFPYEQDHGVCHYPRELQDRMEQYLVQELKERMPEDKIFLWGMEEGDAIF